MIILRVRITKYPKAALAKQAKSEGTTPGALVRRLIQERPFTTSADMLAEMLSLIGNKSLNASNHRPAPS